MPSKKVRTTLYDINRDSWSDSELLEWYNSAIPAIIANRPDAHYSREIFLCREGAAQTLPDKGIRLIRVDNNVGGDVVRFRDRDMMDKDIPGWMSEEGEEVEYFSMDDRYPRTFYIYPTPPAGHQINIVFSSLPEEVKITNFETDQTIISIDDTYQDAIFDYVMFRALSKDAEFADSAQRAVTHLNAFNGFLGSKTQSDAGVTPTNDQSVRAV